MRKEIKNKFPHKLSITTVSMADLHNPYHHHGMKPMIYNLTLQKAKSLFNHRFKWFLPKPLAPLQIDSFSHCAYLVHDLRNRYLILDPESQTELELFFPHMLKRTKHFFRDALFLMSGRADESIHMPLFRIHFSAIDDNFPEKLLCLKKIFLSPRRSSIMIGTYETIFDTLSIAYDILIAYMVKLADESVSYIASLKA